MAISTTHQALRLARRRQGCNCPRFRRGGNPCEYRPSLPRNDVLVERMGLRGVELMVGARNDPERGAIILARFGGVQAELIRDV